MKLPRSTAEIAACLAALLAGPVIAQAPEMATVPGGDFLRGRTHDWPDTRLKWYPNPLKDDVPVGPIVLDPFLIDKAEVTNGQYLEFAGKTGHRTPFHWIDGRPAADATNQPVANVSWEDASAYCAWAGKRLPTEAEWEKACRGGREGEMYPWGDEEPTEERARFGAPDDGPVDVCEKAKNDLGLCDMSGNVWEWTADWWGRTYYGEAPEVNPPGPDEGQYKVLRGGSWFDKKESLFLTCSYRSWARPAERSPTIGFRCARSADSTEPTPAAKSP